MKFQEAIKICLNAKLKVYPVHSKDGWRIEVDQNGETNTIKKVIKNKEIDQAMKKTYIYYAKKIQS